MSDLISAEMPSNIALIKYMGKVKGGERNRPTNSSLSYTLNHLRTRVELHPIAGTYDEWQTIQTNSEWQTIQANSEMQTTQKDNQSHWMATQLSERGRKRYLAHFGFLKQKLGIEGCFSVRSANNFPSDCGIASSASSFAALTQAAYLLAQKQNPKLDFSLEKIAELSRIGSGSSVRSFVSPFALWSENGISEFKIPYSHLLHQVVIVDHEKKAIGSSDAHERVSTSLLFHNRPERAEERLKQLTTAFAEKNWSAAFQIVWAEFWDMHALFATSVPAFQYMNSDSLKVIDYAQQKWLTDGDGPLVTMDAGANVHFLFRDDQVEMERLYAKELRDQYQYQIVSSQDSVQVGLK